MGFFKWSLLSSHILEEHISIPSYVLARLPSAAVLRISDAHRYHTVLQMFTQFCLFLLKMFRRPGIREGGKPLPLAFQYLIFMVPRPCDLNLVLLSSLATKCQHFKLRGLQFHYIKWMKIGHFNFKVLAFCSQWRYHYQIQITRSLYHKNQLLKC